MAAIASLGASLISWLLGMVARAVLEGMQANILLLPDWAYDVGGMIDEVTNSSISLSIYGVFKNFAITFLVLMFLWKGIQQYILYTDGDPDTEPLQFCGLYIKAIAVIACGREVVTWFVKTISALCAYMLETVSSHTGTSGTWDGFVSEFQSPDPDTIESGIVLLVFAIIFGVLLYIIMFSCLKTGMELFFLWAGMPLAAAAGLMNADKGVFKAYTMSIAKALLTIFIKVVLSQLSLSILMCSMTGTSGTLSGLFWGLILGIICVTFALSAPKLLSEFMIPSGGGGMGMMKVYYASNMIKSLRK